MDQSNNIFLSFLPIFFFFNVTGVFGVYYIYTMYIYMYILYMCMYILYICMYILSNSHTSSDVDECSLNRHRCHSDGECTNTEGSYTCSCKNGFSGDGFYCQQKLTCDELQCDVNGECSISELTRGPNVGAGKLSYCLSPSLFLSLPLFFSLWLSLSVSLALFFSLSFFTFILLVL